MQLQFKQLLLNEQSIHVLTNQVYMIIIVLTL